MVIRTSEDIDFSTFPESDGQAMAETRAEVVQMVDLQWELQALFSLQGRAPVTVGGNQFVYYNPANGRDNISPDVYVVFGVAVPSPAKWRTWVEGKFPDIVFEITSPSTQAHDLSEGPRGKRRLYAELGAQEYYIYDPQQVMDLPFLGYALRDGRMEPLAALPGGGVWSPLLGTELRPLAMARIEWRPAGVWLRVIDPRTGEPIPIAEEEHVAFRTTRERLTATRERLAATREQLTTTRGQLTSTRGQLTSTRGQLTTTQEQLTTTREQLDLKELARLAVEERAVSVETELRRLRDELAQRHDQDPMS